MDQINIGLDFVRKKVDISVINLSESLKSRLPGAKASRGAPAAGEDAVPAPASDQVGAMGPPERPLKLRRIGGSAADVFFFMPVLSKLLCTSLGHS